MSLLSGIGKLFSWLLNLVKKLLKNIWVILAIIVIVLLMYYCMPCVAFFLTIWQYLLAGLTAAWGWIASAGSAAWAWFQSLSFGEVVKLAAGAAILIDPKKAADAVGGLIGGVVDEVLDSPVGTLLMIGLGAWLFLGLLGKRKKDDERERERTARYGPTTRGRNV